MNEPAGASRPDSAVYTRRRLVVATAAVLVPSLSYSLLRRGSVRSIVDGVVDDRRCELGAVDRIDGSGIHGRVDGGAVGCFRSLACRRGEWFESDCVAGSVARTRV